MTFPTENKQKGFALLIAVVIAGILISITFIMFSISLKQVTLSTTGKNSQFALYAADTGIECALYASNHIEDVFETQAHDASGVTTVLSVPSTKTFSCNGTVINYTSSQGATVKGVTYVANKGITSTFIVRYPGDQTVYPQCAQVTVRRYVYTKTENSLSIDYLGTAIESRGYNSCTNLDPQRLERGLEVYF